MATVDINIGNKPYKLTVAEGQEARLKKVANQFDTVVSELRQNVPDIDRDRLLVLAAMKLSDDLLSAQQNEETMTQSIQRFHTTLADRITNLSRKIG